MNKEIIPGDWVVQSIRLICGQKALLDSGLGAFYGVSTKVLNHALKRNWLCTRA